MKRTQVIAWIELVDVVFKKKIIIKKKPQTHKPTHTRSFGQNPTDIFPQPKNIL